LDIKNFKDKDNGIQLNFVVTIFEEY